MNYAKKFHAFSCAVFVACFCSFAQDTGVAAVQPDAPALAPGTTIGAKIRLDQRSKKKVRKLKRIEPGTTLGTNEKPVPCDRTTCSSQPCPGHLFPGGSTIQHSHGCD